MTRNSIRLSIAFAAALLALPMGTPDPRHPAARVPGGRIAGPSGQQDQGPGGGALGFLSGLFGDSSPRVHGFTPSGGLRTVLDTIAASSCGGRIGDRVWHDFDEDGIQGAGEKGLPGVVVLLLDERGDRLDLTATDASGSYAFTGLCAGNYFVKVVEATLPGGFKQTPVLEGRDPAVDNDPNPTLVPLTGDTDSDPTHDFGFQCSRTDLDEGCTPGYWKQRRHFDSWSYDPNTLFSDVFEDAFPGMSLVEVAAQGGGGLKALGRHTVAALLNSTAVGVGYNLSQSEVVDLFNDVFPGTKSEYENVKNGFVALNEMGCPLN